MGALACPLEGELFQHSVPGPPGIPSTLVMCLHWEAAIASVTTLESNPEEEINCVQGD